jgi:hypothetical protein
MSLVAVVVAAVLAILARPADARVVDLEEFKSELSTTRAFENVRFMAEESVNNTDSGENDDEDDDDSAAGVVAAAGVTIAALSFAI